MNINNGILKTGSQPISDEIIQRRKFLRKLDEKPSDSSFSDMIKEAVNSVDQASKTADSQVEDVVAGKTDNIHEVMISLQKAQLSFQLMLEIRNKALETYQELSRMQL